MALVRLRKPGSVHTIDVDGVSVEAGVGEPLAMAIGASGRLLLSRSVKYHRPRGAACYSNQCDGCLMRVDGVQSVPTCTRRVEGAHVCRTQNVLGSAESDLLSVTDWFFSGGLDHHHMFTRFGPINRIMQKVARRIAGVGTLPDETPQTTSVVTQDADVLIVGAGRSGLRLACKLSRSGRNVLIVDERTVLASKCEALRSEAQRAGTKLQLGISVLGVYEQSVLAFDGIHCTVFEPKQLVLATGSYENIPAIEGADHPGVISAHAAHRLLDEGFLPGKKAILLTAHTGAGFELSRRFERAGLAVPTVVVDHVARIRGGNTVDLVELSNGERSEVDAVICAGFRTGVYELAVQAGASARFADGGFWVDADEHGSVASRVYAVGTCADSRARDDASIGRRLDQVAKHINEHIHVG